MALHITGGNLAKARKLNPYKRIQKGTEFNIKVDGEDVVAITDAAGKYTYLTVGGVECYISDVVEEGVEYTTTDIVPKPKPEPKVKAEGEEGGDEAAPKKGRRRKTEQVEEAAAA